MSNVLYYPRLCSIPMYDIAPIAVPQYLTKHFLDHPFRFTIRDWEIPAKYCQKWQKNDVAYMQFIANFSALTVEVINVHERIFATVTPAPVLQSADQPGFFAYDCAVSFASLPEGVYFIRLKGDATVIMISEPLHIAVEHPNTILFEYRNTTFHGDVIFESGIAFTFRVEGNIGRVLPGSEDVNFNDQKRNPTLLSSKTFNNYALNIGGRRGIPDWAIDKLNLIFSCDRVLIDGKLYGKGGQNGGFQFLEETEYPLRAITMEIQEGYNRTSKILNPDINTDTALTVVYNIRTSAIFGNIPVPDNNTITIVNSE